jgi:hypothetical protein
LSYHIVTEKQARDVKVGDHVMTPYGPEKILSRRRHGVSGRLLFGHGVGRQFTRSDDDPVFTCPAPVKAEVAP